MAGACGLIAMAALAVVGPLVTDIDPNRADLTSVLLPPSAQHWLGTDPLGRDVLVRALYGIRISLIAGIGAVTIYLLIGSLIGLVSGLVGGWVDHTLMRITDAMLSIPILLLLIMAAAILGPSLQTVILVIGLLGWPATARLVRGQVLAVKDSDFVHASRLTGLTPFRVALRHVVPNVLGPVTVLATFGIANAVIIEASLSFLGLGVRPPSASLGVMINDARAPRLLAGSPWLWLVPGIAISMIVLSTNAVGDGIRDAVDPRTRARG